MKDQRDATGSLVQVQVGKGITVFRYYVRTRAVATITENFCTGVANTEYHQAQGTGQTSPAQ